MRIISARELESWLTKGKVIEKDPRGPKVVILENGLFLKIFHSRRHPLLARLQPAALRFKRNAKRLNGYGIHTPEVIDIFWLDIQKGLSACLYRPLQGISFEQLVLNEPQKADSKIEQLAVFIHQLHQNGIYFRSLHLGNVLLLDQGDLGLIDILDIRFKGKKLNTWQVKRNFAHLENYLQRKKLPEFQIKYLFDAYEQHSKRR